MHKCCPFSGATCAENEILLCRFPPPCAYVQPPHGTPIKGRDVVICQFPPDPTVALGALSTVAAACCAGIGALSVFFPYNGKSVPRKALFHYTVLYVFFHLAM